MKRFQKHESLKILKIATRFDMPLILFHIDHFRQDTWNLL